MRKLGANDTFTALVLSSDQTKLAGIGAGDVLAANLAARLVTQKQLDYLDACEHAVPRATAFCKKAAEIRKRGDGGKAGWYGVGVSETLDTIEEVKAGFKSGIVTPLSGAVNVLVNNKNQHKMRCQEALRSAKPVSIQNASWFLDRFLTVDKKLGSEILRVKSEIRLYFADQDRNAKPFVVALCGSPGSGKSALAEALAKASGCEVRNANAAQWTSVEDLFRLCEEIRTIRVKGEKALVFIDEVDTAVDGEKLYGKLLAPFGDGTYSTLGYTRQLGPVVFLLAGSNEPWTTAKGLLDFGHEEGRSAGKKGQSTGNKADSHPKLRDLVSRFSSPPVEVPALGQRRLDALYLAAFLLHEQYPGIEHVERGVLRLLCESEPKHGPRSIRTVVRMFSALKDPSCVTREDLKQSDDSIALHLGKPPRPRKDDSVRVRIIP